MMQASAPFREREVPSFEEMPSRGLTSGASGERGESAACRGWAAPMAVHPGTGCQRRENERLTTMSRGTGVPDRVAGL